MHCRYQRHLSLCHSMIHFKYCMNSNTRGKVNSQTILQHKITTLCMESAALQLPEAAERRSSLSRYCGSGDTCRYKQDATVCQLLIPLTYRTHTATTLPLQAPPSVAAARCCARGPDCTPLGRRTGRCCARGPDCTPLGRRTRRCCARGLDCTPLGRRTGR